MITTIAKSAKRRKILSASIIASQICSHDKNMEDLQLSSIELTVLLPSRYRPIQHTHTTVVVLLLLNQLVLPGNIVVHIRLLVYVGFKKCCLGIGCQRRSQWAHLNSKLQLALLQLLKLLRKALRSLKPPIFCELIELGLVGINGDPIDCLGIVCS